MKWPAPDINKSLINRSRVILKHIKFVKIHERKICRDIFDIIQRGKYNFMQNKHLKSLSNDGRQKIAYIHQSVRQVF